MSKILKRPGAEPSIVKISVIADEPACQALPKCPACAGSGHKQGLVGNLSCTDCHGTGVDLKHAVGVIKHQAQRLVNAEKAYAELKHRYLMAVNPGEAQRRAVDRFYRDSQYNKHD